MFGDRERQTKIWSMADGKKGNRKNIRRSKGRKSAEVGKLIFYKECSGGGI